MHIQFHLTNLCNFSCKHCYQIEKNKTMSFEQYRYCINQVKEYIGDEPSTISLTGGEPFLIKNIIEYIKYAKTNGFEVSILTNGSLLTDEICRELKRIGILRLQVSLEGPKPINDMIRGNGSFDKIINGIKIAKKNGITVSVSNTINELNYKYIDELYDVINAIGVDFIWFDRLIPYQQNEILPINTSQFIEFLIMLKKLKLKSLSNKVTQVRDKRALQFLPGTETNMLVYSCSACKYINISPSGDVYSCVRMGIKIGNIFKNTITEIYKLKSTVDLRNKINKIPDECLSCCFKNFCRGGLKCLTYVKTNSFNYGDLNCPFLKENHIEKATIKSYGL